MASCAEGCESLASSASSRRGLLRVLQLLGRRCPPIQPSIATRPTQPAPARSPAEPSPPSWMPHSRLPDRSRVAACWLKRRNPSLLADANPANPSLRPPLSPSRHAPWGAADWPHPSRQAGRLQGSAGASGVASNPCPRPSVLSRALVANVPRARALARSQPEWLPRLFGPVNVTWAAWRSLVGWLPAPRRGGSRQLTRLASRIGWACRGSVTVVALVCHACVGMAGAQWQRICPKSTPLYWTQPTHSAKIRQSDRPRRSGGYSHFSVTFRPVS
jgi:hypothetical protein